MNKKLYLTLLCPLIPFVLTTSCNKTNEINSDYVKPEEDNNKPNTDIESNPNFDDNFTMPIIQTTWKQGFRDTKTSFLESDYETVKFDLNEIILDNVDYQIIYSGKNQEKHFFNLYDKNIMKHYLVQCDCDYQFLFEKFSRPKIKTYISTTILNSYEKEMIINHEVNGDKFFVFSDYSDRSIDFQKNPILKFKSSWGVGNQQSKDVIFNLNVSGRKIREMLFGLSEINYDNFILESVSLIDIFILPKTIVLSNPVNWFEFKIKDIKDNETNKNLNITNDERQFIKLDIAGKNGSGSSHWVGNVAGTTLSGSISSTNYPGGISGMVGTMINQNNTDYGDVLNKINSSNKFKVKDHVNNIFKNAKRIKVDKTKKFAIDDDFLSFNIISEIKASANASNIFGDTTEIGLYNIDTIQKMNVTFKEYKKF